MSVHLVHSFQNELHKNVCQLFHLSAVCMFLCSLRGIYSFIEVLSSFHVLQAAELAIKFLAHDKAVDVSQVVGPRLIQLRRYNEVCLFYLFSDIEAHSSL